MTAEFTAAWARKLTDNRDELSAEMWYAKYKDQLFSEVQTIALDEKGSNQIQISSSEWDNNETKKKYLMSRLESLGYGVTIENNYNSTMKLMIISW